MRDEFRAWIKGTITVLRKDLLLEIRSRYVLNTLLVFVLSTLFLVLLGAGQTTLNAQLQAGLLWIVILFTAALGMGRSFIAEEECGTVLFLRLHTRPSMIYAGKLCFSLMIMLTVNLVIAGVFLVLLGVQVAFPGLFVVSLGLGTLGLAGATTLLAAIIARTSRGGPLLPMLLFPLLMPLLLSAVQATENSLMGSQLTEGAWENSFQSLIAMSSFAAW